MLPGEALSIDAEPVSRSPEGTKALVREYYGSLARSAGGCCSEPRTCACGNPRTLALAVGYGEEDLEAVPQGANQGLGCGNPVALADLRPGEVVLDLGSGAGFDAFLAASKVGGSGRVIGVDLTEEMVAKARRLAIVGGHTNTEFRMGDVEALPIEENSMDVVISNCVLNLAPDKNRAFAEAYRVLKPGGRLVVSDLVLTHPLPKELLESEEALVGCVGGAILREAYLEAIRAAGFEEVKVMAESPFGESDLPVASLKVRGIKPRIQRGPMAESGHGCACSGPSLPIEQSLSNDERGLRRFALWGLPMLAVGTGLYVTLERLAAWLTVHGLGLSLSSRLGAAVAFFAYDAPKVLLLLAAITFGVGFLQSYLSPEKTRDALAHRGGLLGNLLASLFGIVTPFCSCSAVPLFIGFVRVGVPLGVTFSYLVAAPMINEVALVLLLAMFGWKIALIYAGTGVAVAFLSGALLGRLRMESHLEPWVLEIPFQRQSAAARRLRLEDRVDQAWQSTRSIVGKVWPYVLLGLAVGAFIHGYVPEGLLARFMGKGQWWTVPLAVLIGVPLYASTAVILPIVQTLLAKGAALGTVLAFMMAVTGLSLPETIILRKVLKPRLILVFLGVVSLGILGVGYHFNLML